MKDERLTRYVEVGLPHLRQVSRLPEYLVPDVADVAHELGDQAMLKLAEPLGLSEGIKSLLNQSPEADSLPGEIWEVDIGRWQAVRQVVPVTLALLRACDKVEALERRGVAGMNSATTVRGLATIAFATFAPNGGKILDRLAGILGGNPAEPAALLNLYVKAMENGDKDTLADVEECILQYPAWAEWSKRFIAEGMAFPFIPRVIGVSPVPTGELIRLLAAMIVEVTNADRIRDIRN